MRMAVVLARSASDPPAANAASRDTDGTVTVNV